MMSQQSRTFDPTKFLGAPIVIETTFGDVYRGEVFCYDIGPVNCLILKELNEDNTANFRLFRLNIIREVHAEGLPPVTINNYLPPCDKNILNKIEKKLLNDFEKKRHTIGIGVTQDAQLLFDFIWKTHPECVWKDADILVMGVTITPPYAPENCHSKDNRLKERMQLVISRFREKQDKDKRLKVQREIQNSLNLNNNNLNINNNNIHMSNHSIGNNINNNAAISNNNNSLISNCNNNQNSNCNISVCYSSSASASSISSSSSSSSASSSVSAHSEDRSNRVGNTEVN